MTHDVDEAFRLADRIVVMRAGRVEQVAPPHELFERPATPYVRELVHAGDDVYRRYFMHGRELLRAWRNELSLEPSATRRRAWRPAISSSSRVALAAALALRACRSESSPRAAQRVAPWLLGTLGAIYTIPSLALLAVLVQRFGLGFTPIFVALVVYAQFMLARNVVAGITGVDPRAGRRRARARACRRCRCCCGSSFRKRCRCRSAACASRRSR